MELLPGNSQNNSTKLDQISLKAIAHLGDAVYELFVRNKLIYITPKMVNLHKLTTSVVNSYFHADLLEFLTPHLTESELDIVRRARNQTVTTAKRREQTVHRISTSFEALLGYLYLTDSSRLKFLLDIIDKYIDQKIEELKNSGNIIL